MGPRKVPNGRLNSVGGIKGRGLWLAQQGTTVAGHPYPHAVEAAVHFAATPVLLEERVEGLADCVHGRAKDSVVLGEAHRPFFDTPRARLRSRGTAANVLLKERSHS